jgi:hypothetical protein
MCSPPRPPTPTIASCNRSPDFSGAAFFLLFFSAAKASAAGNAAATAAASMESERNCRRVS